MLSVLLQGTILGLSITAPIGPTNIELIRRGMKEGPGAAVAFWLGVMVALAVYLLLAVVGLSFLTGSRLFNLLLTFCGVVVLAYLSMHSIRDFLSTGDTDFEGKPNDNHHFVPGILLTISNPAVLLLWTGILGANLSASQASIGAGFALCLGIMVGVAVFFLVLTVLIHYGRRFLQQRYLRYVSLAAGIVLMLFCVKFAYGLITTLFFQ